MPTVTVRGLDELKREMARLSDAAATRIARNATMAGARVIARHARARAPVETGVLRASIKAKRDPNWRTARGTVQSFANAAAFYSRFAEFGTAHQPARPFLRPAADEAAGEARDKMIANLAVGIEREVKKQSVPEDVGEL